MLADSNDTFKKSSIISVFQFSDSCTLKTPFSYTAALINWHPVLHNKFNFNG